MPTGRTIIDVIKGVELEENGPVRTVMRITGELAGMRPGSAGRVVPRAEEGRPRELSGLDAGQVDECRAGFPVAAAERGNSVGNSFRDGDSRGHDAECGPASARRDAQGMFGANGVRFRTGSSLEAKIGGIPSPPTISF